MIDAPSVIDALQLKELHIDLNLKKLSENAGNQLFY
jgi:hypothetical protein